MSRRPPSDDMVEIVFLIACMLAIAIVLRGCGRPAEAAVWQPVRIVTPGCGPDSSEQAVAYVGQRWKRATGWQPANLWRGPSATTGAAVPKAPGTNDTIWINVSQEPKYWRAGGEVIRIAQVSAAGDTGRWSNYRVQAAGMPRDTLFFDVAGTAWLVRPGDLPGRDGGWTVSRPNPLAPSIYEVSWVRVAGDTVLDAPARYGDLRGHGPLVHYEDLVLALRHPLCSMFGAVSLRGTFNRSICDTIHSTSAPADQRSLSGAGSGRRSTPASNRKPSP